MDARVESFLEKTCLFCQPWWLEAVSPGAWDVAVSWRGEEVAGVWPFAFKRRLNSFLLVEMPPLTPYLGPWLRPSSARYAANLGEQKELIGELADALPLAASFSQHFHPSCTNWLPLFWRGYQQTTRYTYRLDATASPGAVWDEMLKGHRAEIRKAERSLSIAESTDIDSFVELHSRTFARQSKMLPYAPDVLRAVDRACAGRGAKQLFFAVDMNGQRRAAGYFVSDASTMYYLLGARDDYEGGSGAASLIIWTAMQRALARGLHFDFEGSVVEGIERFFRGFGATQVPYFEVSRTPSRVVRTYRSLLTWLPR